MDRRKNIRMARSMPPIGKGLGNLDRLIDRLGAHRVNPHARATNRKVLLRFVNFRIRLLEAGSWTDPEVEFGLIRV